jgi:adenine-specific DNA methylase
MKLWKHKMFDALLSYPGGKRRLLGEIFKLLPPAHEAPVLIDSFLGGGSVSLYAKARGYQVLCNDIAARSRIVGQALIENDRETLSEADTLRLFAPCGGDTGFIEQHFSPDVFTSKHARFLDNAWAAARQATGVKRALLELLLVKYCFRMRPMGNFGAKTIIHQMEEGRWEEMNPNYLRDALTQKINGHPKRIVESLRRDVNSGVFSNGKSNMVFCQDVFAFLPGVQGDIAYFDPPYAGTMSYETSLKVVDQILEGEVRQPQKSLFSRKDAVQVLESLFAAARHIPIWAVSYGNATLTLDELTELVRKFKPQVTARAINYVHCTGLAGEESRRRNQEFVIVARN